LLSRKPFRFAAVALALLKEPEPEQAIRLKFEAMSALPSHRSSLCDEVALMAFLLSGN
jgi:hypothetical protein